MEVLFKDFEIGDYKGAELMEAIKEKYGKDKELNAEEYLAFMTEFLANPSNLFVVWISVKLYPFEEKAFRFTTNGSNELGKSITLEAYPASSFTARIGARYKPLFVESTAMI